jgi:hypothetical protein
MTTCTIDAEPGVILLYKGKPAYLAGRFTWKGASKSHTGEEEEQRQKKGT